MLRFDTTRIIRGPDRQLIEFMLGTNQIPDDKRIGWELRCRKALREQYPELVGTRKPESARAGDFDEWANEMVRKFGETLPVTQFDN
jgi:hypothetical protein